MTSWLILQVIWNLKSASYALAIITIVLVNDHINFLNKQKWIKLNIENNRKIMQSDTRKSRLTKIGRKTGIWKIGKKPISENTKNFEIKIFLWIEESITNNYRYIRSSYLEIDPILSEPVGMIISFITDGIHYYIKFWSQNFSPLPTFHRTYTKSSSILLITP